MQSRGRKSHGGIIYVFVFCTGWGKKKYDSLIYYNLKSKRAITLK